MRIIGIDPGLRRCGWGVLEQAGSKLALVAHGVVKPPTEGALAQRLAALYDGLAAIIAEHAPKEAAVEETFVNENAASALKLGQARGVCLLAPARAGLTVAEYAPRLVKKSVVGAGGADKAQVAAMIGVLLPGAKASADAADALAVAVAHAHHRATARQIAGRGR